MKQGLLLLILFCFHFAGHTAVILQYHHVSDSTPKSTSITPKQFAVHLQYLKDQNFSVVPLSQIVNQLKTKQPLTDKTVAITFDDAYTDLITQAVPLLDKFNFPYTIFVNPEVINQNNQRKDSHFLSWAQLKSLTEKGAIIANHGMSHDSLTRIPDDLTPHQWLEKQTAQLLKAEATIKQETGQSWHYFAYPYGEYSPEIQTWVKQNGFIAFSQQSGAVGKHTDLTSIPRFPASMPYDKLSGLRDKLNSLAFNIQLEGDNAETVFVYKQAKSVSFTIESNDFYKSQLNCYISGLGKQKINWQGDNSFTITFNDDLPVGRVRANCTAASINNPGRYYWYSKPWFVLKADGSWYHL